MKQLYMFKSLLIACIMMLFGGGNFAFAELRTLTYTFDSTVKDGITGNTYTNQYNPHRWTVSNEDGTFYMGGVVGVQSKMLAMRYASTRTGEMLGNIDPSYDASSSYTVPSGVTGAIPGRITNISVTCGGTTTRGIYIYAGTSQIVDKTKAPTALTAQFTSEKQTGANVSVDMPAGTNYTYFAITGANSSFSGVSSYTITYEVSSAPAITASDVVEYAADILNGEIPYTISNPVEGTSLAATTSTEWISEVTVGESAVTFTMEENTGAERTGTITLSYGELTKDITVKQSAAVAKRTVTIETPANGTLKVFRDAEEIISGAQIPEGTELTIEATPSEGYKFRNWQAVDASTHTYTANFTYTIGTSDVTFKANFDAIVYNTITWNVNGVENTTKVETGTDITFPEQPKPINGYEFVGWSATTHEPSNTAPELVTSATATADVTYYAVFAKSSGKAAILEKMTADDDFAAGDNVVIVAVVNETTSYGLYQETTNTSYVKNFAFDGKAETIGADDKNWLTVSGSAGSWTLGDDTNGYLYNSGSNNELSINTTSATWGLEKTSGKFKLKINSRYLSCRNDLKAPNTNLFRLGGANGGNSGITEFDIYKFTPGSKTYYNYTTSIPTTGTFTFVAQDADGNYYATFSTDHYIVFPEEVELSAVNGINEDGTLHYFVKRLETMTVTDEVGSVKGSLVPKNTGVLLKSSKAEVTYYFPISDVTGSINSWFKPVTNEDGTFEGREGYKYYKLAYNDYEAKTGLGFYWGAENGAPFKSKKGLAYLEIPETTTSGAAPTHFLIGGGTDGISNVESDVKADKDGVIYNIAGQRVNAATKPGLYIIDGKKVVVK